MMNYSYAFRSDGTTVNEVLNTTLLSKTSQELLKRRCAGGLFGRHRLVTKLPVVLVCWLICF